LNSGDYEKGRNVWGETQPKSVGKEMATGVRVALQGTVPFGEESGGDIKLQRAGLGRGGGEKLNPLQQGELCYG